MWQALLLPGFLSACGKVGGTPILRPGLILPSVELPLLDGKGDRFVETSASRLINFWATWCPPCRAEMASLNRLHNAYKARGLGVFAVSVDEDANLVREFVRQASMDFTILLDPGARVTTPKLGVSVFPTSILIDHQARIREVWIGEQNWDAPDIRAPIDQLIGF